MKGRIIEINDGYAIVFTKNGEFVKTKNYGKASMGDEINIRPQIFNYTKPLVSAAAAIAIMSLGAISYCMPTSYVDICINPEIELKLNMFDIVVGAEGQNKDGITVLDKNNVKNAKLDKALDNIISNAQNLGFIPEDEEKTIVLAVFAKNENTAKELYDDVQLYQVPEKINKVVKLASNDDISNASIEKMPVGKYLLVNEIADVVTDKPKEEWKNCSVKEIITTLDKIKTITDDISNKSVDTSKTENISIENKGETTPKPTIDIIIPNTPNPSISKESEVVDNSDKKYYFRTIEEKNTTVKQKKKASGNKSVQKVENTTLNTNKNHSSNIVETVDKINNINRTPVFKEQITTDTDNNWNSTKTETDGHKFESEKEINNVKKVPSINIDNEFTKDNSTEFKPIKDNSMAENISDKNEQNDNSTEKVPSVNKPNDTESEKTPTESKPNNTEVEKTPNENIQNDNSAEKIPSVNKPNDTESEKAPAESKPNGNAVEKTPDENEQNNNSTEKVPSVNKPNDTESEKNPTESKPNNTEVEKPHYENNQTNNEVKKEPIDSKPQENNQKETTSTEKAPIQNATVNNNKTPVNNNNNHNNTSTESGSKQQGNNADNPSTNSDNAGSEKATNNSSSSSSMGSLSSSGNDSNNSGGSSNSGKDTGGNKDSGTGSKPKPQGGKNLGGQNKKNNRP